MKFPYEIGKYGEMKNPYDTMRIIGEMKKLRIGVLKIMEIRK